MEKKLICPRCNNTNPAYFYLGSKGYYCRKCIGFSQSLIAQSLEFDAVIPIESEYQLPFELSAKQIKAAEIVKNNYQNNNILVYAACGAGKSELMLPLIKDALAKGYIVGWAIPRRSVVIQLAQRLQEYFNSIKVISVCQGYTDVIFADLIICTTYQLYRYTKYFDYLIIDEPDAFPFKNNELLQNIALNSYKNKLIFLTATPDDFVLSKYDIKVELFARAHGYDLIVPEIKQTIKYFDILVLFNLIRKNTGKLLVFIPTIKLTKQLYYLFKSFFKCQMITSLTNNKDETISDFIESDKMVLFSTTILERGVTIPNVNVVVFRANHIVFDTASLVQMTGRVGRVVDYPDGDCFFIVNQKSSEVSECLNLLKDMIKNA